MIANANQYNRPNTVDALARVLCEINLKTNKTLLYCVARVDSIALEIR